MSDRTGVNVERHVITYPGEEREQEIRIAALDAASRVYTGTTRAPYNLLDDAALFERYIKTGEVR